MTTSFEKPLSGIEVRSLNRVGLTPQNLPRSLDDFIRWFLWDKAEVEVSPVSSKNMVGGSVAALGSGIGAVLVKEGGASVGTSFTTQNIKQQTGVQEWIHWKKYALDHPDFEQYREEWTVKAGQQYEEMVRYIRSDKGKECCDYEHWRPLARVSIVVVSSFLSLAGWAIAYGVNKWLISNKGVTLPELVIQKVLMKRSFASIRPHVKVIDGLLELEYGVSDDSKDTEESANKSIADAQRRRILGGS
jgi:hypothetical protein